MRPFKPWHRKPKIRAAWEHRAALKASLLDAGHLPSSLEWDELDAYDRKIAKMLAADEIAEREEDRRKHPKAKRNQPVGSEGSAPTRYI